MAAFAPSRPTLAVGLLTFAVAIALGMAGRYVLVENIPLAHACEAGGQSFTCTARLAILLGFRTPGPAALAVLLGLWTLWRPSPAALVATLAAAGLLLFLFNAWPAGLVLVLAILSLARPARA